VVVPIPDPEFGARPVAFVRMADGIVEGETLARALEKVLPRFKVPVAFHGWPEGAGLGGMKVDRAVFHERASRPRREGRG
jgi:O-succinylbenzoic acid--CoA ligase